MNEPSENPFKRFIGEIHRRSLWQVLGIYVVGGWVAFEVVQTLTEGLGLPEWFPALAIVLLIIGLPIVLATAFVEEGGLVGVSSDDLSDLEGILSGEDFAGEKRIAAQGIFTWPNALLGGAAAITLLITVGVGWLTLGIGESLAHYGASPPGAEEVEDRAAASAAIERSVAVLPFADLSPEGDQEWFTDGITEEVLNALAQLPGVRVPARTSSFAFKGRNLPIRVIADTLGVVHVLEGSVRRAGERVLITAQLIDARADTHLWSDTYERELSPAELFAVQREIAGAIADQLQVRLSGSEEEALVADATESTEAYEAYLRGRFAMNDRSPNGIRRATEYFELAIERDPTYAPAYAGLADARSLGWFYGYFTGEEPLRRAEGLARRAVELAPELAEAHTGLGWVQFLLRNGPASEAAFLRALDLNPRYVEAQHWYAVLLAWVGRPEEAIPHAEEAVELDPLAPATHVALALNRRLIDEPMASEAAYRRMLEVEPGYAYGRLWFGGLLSELDRHGEALEEIERARAELPPATDTILGGLSHLAAAHARAGRTETARALIDRAIAAENPPAAIGWVYAELGDRDEAFDWLLRSQWTRDEPLIGRHLLPRDVLGSDPRLQEVMDRMDEAWRLRGG